MAFSPPSRLVAHLFDPLVVLLFFYIYIYIYRLRATTPLPETGRENKPVFMLLSQWMKGPSCLIPITRRDVKEAQDLCMSWLCVGETDRERERGRKKDAEHRTPWAYLTIWQTP